MTVIEKPVTHIQAEATKKHCLYDMEIGGIVTIGIALAAVYVDSVVMICVALCFAFFEVFAVRDYMDACKTCKKKSVE
jgi:hypothetical protein